MSLGILSDLFKDFKDSNGGHLEIWDSKTVHRRNDTEFGA